MTKRRIRDSWYANLLNALRRAAIFIILFLVAIQIYAWLLDDIITDRPHIIALFVLWFFTAYLVLPRINRRIAKIYLPNYFIGRARTADGLLGDPVNLAGYGGREKLIAAMEAAGWTQAVELNLKSSLKMIYCSVRGANYPNAPVSPLFLFNKKEDLAFQKQIGRNPRKRHHVRFWFAPDDWWLPGGHKVDWLGAATLDKNVGLSLFTGQITHKIDANTDQERDFVIETLQKAKATRYIEVIKHFTSSYHSRNGGGDVIHTDGSLPFISFK